MSNVPMRHRTLILLASVVVGCNDAGDATGPAKPAAATTTATTTGKRPALKPIELQYGIYLARLDLRITVSPDGKLRSVWTTGKSYGGNDIDPKQERVEVREGRLTGEQVADLAGLFDRWDVLSPEPYGGVADGGDVSIRYGDRSVSGGSAVPEQVTLVRVRLMELARSMPVQKP